MIDEGVGMRELPTIRQIVNWVQIHIENSEVGEVSVTSAVLDRYSVRKIKECTHFHCYFDYYRSKFIFSKEELSEERCEEDKLNVVK